jgi:hypothetical protein
MVCATGARRLPNGETEWLVASHIGPAQRQGNGFPHNIGLAGTYG